MVSLSRSELPEEIEKAIAEVVATQRVFVSLCRHPSNREAWQASLACSDALNALTAAILSRLGNGAPASPSGSQASPEAPTDPRPSGVDPSRGPPDIDSIIAIWSMRPPPLTVAGQCWEDGARQGWAWAWERAAQGTEARSAEKSGGFND